MSLERMFDTLEGLRSTASVDVAFGKPQETNGRTMIPVSTVQVGMGLDDLGQGDMEHAQASDEPPSGGGGGGGAGARPIAMIEVTADQTIIHPIVDETKVALAGIALGAWIIFLLLVTIRRVFAEGNDDTMNVKLAYGRTGLTVALPAEAETTLLSPRFVPGLEDEPAAMQEALRNPIESPPLLELVSPGDKVAIVFSDITRPQPRERMLPVLLDELASCVPNEQILLINGLGTHRANTDAELRTMLGDAIVDRYTIHQHDSRDESQMVYLGQSSYDHAIWISRAYMEADVKLLTGFIEPHIFAGYSGGPKAVLPAVAGAEIIMDNHSGRMLSNPKATWGITRGNAVWEEMLEVALLTKPDFLFNVSLNRDKGITGVFCGSLEAAHAAGVAHVRSTAMVAVDEPFDVALTNNSGYPLDLNLYQTDKGVSAAAQVVRRGGAILTASECWDGIPEHGNYKTLLAGADSPQQLLDQVLSPGFREMDQWQAFLHARLCLQADIHIYAQGLTDEQNRLGMFTPSRDIEATLRTLIDRHGPRLCVLPEGPMTIPYLK